MPKVSVIIPVYKAEPYIERCVRTLFEQTLDDLEYIFVDDCSPDRSIEVMESVLAEYPARKSQVKVIRHEVNQGVSSARQHGVDAATGEYIIHCDPDDWVELNMYEALYLKATSNNCEIVLCDYILEYKDKSITKKINIKSTESTYLLLGLVNGNLHGSLWNKLIKRQLIQDNQITFTNQLTIYEDQIFCIKTLKITDKTTYCSHPFYHYDQYSNSNSLVRQKYDKRQLLLWLNEFNTIIEDKESYIYATGYARIAYYFFANNLLTSSEFREMYIDKLGLLIKNDRKLSNKVFIVLSAFGLNKFAYCIYQLIKRLIS